MQLDSGQDHISYHIISYHTISYHIISYLYVIYTLSLSILVASLTLFSFVLLYFQCPCRQDNAPAKKALYTGAVQNSQLDDRNTAQELQNDGKEIAVCMVLV